MAGCRRPVRSQLGRQEVVMFTSKTKVLLILTQDVLDRARVLAGKATTALKLPVSLQLAEANIRLTTRLQQAEGAAYRDREPYSRSRADDASKDAEIGRASCREK